MNDLPAIVPSPNGLTVAQASAGLLKDLLETYFDELVKLGVPVRDHLAPGLSAGQIREVVESEGLVAVDELVAWYETFDGPVFADDERPFYLFPGFDLHSLSRAVDLRERDRKAVGFGDEV